MDGRLDECKANVTGKAELSVTHQKVSRGSQLRHG